MLQRDYHVATNANNNFRVNFLATAEPWRCRQPKNVKHSLTNLRDTTMITIVELTISAVDCSLHVLSICHCQKKTNHASSCKAAQKSTMNLAPETPSFVALSYIRLQPVIPHRSTAQNGGYLPVFFAFNFKFFKIIVPLN